MDSIYNVINYIMLTSLEGLFFSSFNMFIFSLLQDDFAVLSSGLVTQETTIGNNNNDLWQYVQPEGQVRIPSCIAISVLLLHSP